MSPWPPPREAVGSHKHGQLLGSGPVRQGGYTERGKVGKGKSRQEARQLCRLTGAAPGCPARTEWQQCPWLAYQDKGTTSLGLLQQPPVSASSLQKSWCNFVSHWFILGWGFVPTSFSLSAHPVQAASSWMWQRVARRAVAQHCLRNQSAANPSGPLLYPLSCVPKTKQSVLTLPYLSLVPWPCALKTSLWLCGNGTRWGRSPGLPRQRSHCSMELTPVFGPLPLCPLCHLSRAGGRHFCHPSSQPTHKAPR